jgi:two-component system response regulator FixJ
LGQRHLAIYVVDDDEHVRDSLETLLGSHGYRVRGYRSAEEFLAALPCLEHPALAVVDLDLPGQGGLGLVASLAGRLPAIVITGRVDEASRLAAAEAGAVACFFKPFEPTLLLDEIARHHG